MEVCSAEDTIIDEILHNRVEPQDNKEESVDKIIRESFNEEEREEKDEEEASFEATSATSETAPLRRSARVHKPRIEPGFVYPKIVSAVIDDPKPTWIELSLICGLVEESAQRGEAGKLASAKLELERVWKKYGAFHPVKLVKDSKEKIIKGKLFTIEKTDASGNFLKNKSRLVARGDLRKEKFSTLDTFAPTFTFATFLIVLNIILSYDLSWMVVDVESAYLNAKMEGGVYMRLDPKIAKLMKELDPSVNEYIEQDGSIVVKIVRGLYGLQESARLWNLTLKKKLIELGYKQSNYDQALYFKWVGESICVVLVYVDDLLLVGTKAQIEKTKQSLKEDFTINSSELDASEVDYVGIKVIYNQEGKSFSLNQPGYIEKITGKIEGESDMPYDNQLYHEEESDKFEDITAYRSLVMELKYMERTRPDIKVPLGYLTTKMQDPTNRDWKS